MQFPSPGDLFEDTYRIESVLGIGGFARVYQALEIGLDRRVALKILRPPVRDHHSDTERDRYLHTLMQRFQREALMLGKLRCPHTVTMYHYGQTSGGLLYMVLEFIDGYSLADISRAGKTLEADRVVTILKQVLLSLHEAHSLDMLHRDLKPANIMIFEHLGQKDQVKLLDFGIAKAVSAGEANRDLTGDDTLIGTPRYMAPEQIEGASNIGPPADIYALGLVAYELLVGERAITEDNSIQIIGKQMSPNSFRLPRHVDIPPAVRALVNRMMEKQVEHRFQNAMEVYEALKSPNILDPETLSAPFPVVEPAADSLPLAPQMVQFSTASIETPFAAAQAEPDGSSRLYIMAGIGLLLIALIGMIIFAATTQHEPPSQETNALVAKQSDAAPPSTEEETAPPIAPKRVKTVLVSSNVEGVEISLDGELIGTAPIKIPTGDLPAEIVAKWKGEERRMQLEADAESLAVDFEELAAAEDSETAADMGASTDAETDELQPAVPTPSTLKQARTRPHRSPRKAPRKTAPKTEKKADEPKTTPTYLPID